MRTKLSFTLTMRRLWSVTRPHLADIENRGQKQRASSRSRWSAESSTSTGCAMMSSMLTSPSSPMMGLIQKPGTCALPGNVGSDWMVTGFWRFTDTNKECVMCSAFSLSRIECKGFPVTSDLASRKIRTPCCSLRREQKFRRLPRGARSCATGMWSNSNL